MHEFLLDLLWPPQAFGHALRGSPRATDNDVRIHHHVCQSPIAIEWVIEVVIPRFPALFQPVRPHKFRGRVSTIEVFQKIFASKARAFFGRMTKTNIDLTNAIGNSYHEPRLVHATHNRSFDNRQTEANQKFSREGNTTIFHHIIDWGFLCLFTEIDHS